MFLGLFGGHLAKLCQIEESLTLVEELDPSLFAFYRTAQGPSKGDQWMTGIPIFGSVSKRDIADRIRESVSHVKDTATIRLDENNVEIFEKESGDQPLRIIKATGQFTITISYPGHDRKVQHNIAVRPEEVAREASG